MSRAEWFAAATLLLTALGVLQAFGFWRAVYIGLRRRREYYPAWLKSRLKRRAHEARLREAELVAPGLFRFLRQKLAENPNGRLFRVTWGAAVRIEYTTPDFEYADDSGNGYLGHRLEQFARGDRLFSRINADDSPPVYLMSEDLVSYLRQVER